METITNDSSKTDEPSTGRSMAGAGNEAVQASLRALARARQAQRRRTRRERVLASLCAALAIAAAWGISTRFRQQRDAVVAAPPEAAPVVVAAVETNVPPAAPVEVVQQPAPEAPPVVEAAAKPVAEKEARPTCASASKRLPSKQVVAICAAAFDLEPTAESALIVAKEIYRQGQVKEAGVWAEKALELNAELPEAYVIVAYAAEHEGNVDTAATAYRQYLTLAPRGWHARKARQGLRRLRS